MIPRTLMRLGVERRDILNFRFMEREPESDIVPRGLHISPPFQDDFESRISSGSSRGRRDWR